MLTKHLMKESGISIQDPLVLRAASVLARYSIERIIKDSRQFHDQRQSKVREKNRDKILRLRDLSVALKENEIVFARPECYRGQ